MPNNPLLPADILNYYQWSAQNSINPPQLPAGYVLATHPTTTGILALRLFDAAYISTGIIDPNRLGTGATGAGNLYLADDGTWKAVGGGGGGGDMYKATYDVDNDGTVDSAERIEIIVRNSTGTTLTKGTVVYLSGATGNRPNAVRAQADVEATSSKTFGIVVADINNNSDGYVACNGTLHDLDTSAFADGTALWLSATTAGAYTSTIPAEPNHTVFIGYVARSHPTQGRLVILIQNGYELNELHGVLISSEANNDLLTYESSTGLWKNKTISTIFGGTPLVSVPTLAQVTTAGNTTTNSISVGGISATDNFIFTLNRTVNTVSVSPRLRWTGSNVGTIEMYGEQNQLIVSSPSGISASSFQGNFVNFGSNIGSVSSPLLRGTNNFTGGLFFIGGGGVAGNAGIGFSIGNYTEGMRLVSSGNLLIGTTTDAGYKLDVSGTGRYVDTIRVAQSGFLRNADITMGNSLWINASHGGIQFAFAGNNIVNFGGTNNQFFKQTQIGYGTSLITRNASLSVGGSITASTALAQGILYDGTLVAAANNDVLVALDINPTFTNGAFTGVSNYALRLGNSVGVSTANAFTLNYIVFTALTANQGISATFIPNGTPTGFGYNFQFNKSSTANSNCLLFIGGGSAAIGNSANKHVISTSADGTATGQPLVLRVAPTSTSWSVINDHFTIFPTGNVVIQNASSSATDAGYKLDVNGTARIQGNTILLGTLNMGNGSFSYSANPNDQFTITGNQGLILNHGNGNSGGAGGNIILGSSTSPNFTISLSNIVRNGVAISRPVTPISGSSNVEFNSLLIDNSINYTNATSSIARGLYIAPTLTSVSNFRAIETTSGDVILNTQSASVNAGYTTVAVGGSSGVYFQMYVGPSPTSQNLRGQLWAVGNNLLLNNPAAGYLGLFTTLYSGITIWPTTGNVYVGASPSTDTGYKLDVNGTARVKTDLKIETGTGGLTIEGDASGYPTLSINTLRSGVDRRNWKFATEQINVGDFVFYRSSTGGGAANTVVYSVSKDGTVVVGGTTVVNMNYGQVPKLYVSDGTFLDGIIELPTTLRIRASGGGINFQQQSEPSANSLLTFGNDSSGVYYGNYSSLGLRFLVNNVAQMTIASTTGNVLIGTTTDAGVKLDVVGSIRASSILFGSQITNTNSNPVIGSDGSNIGLGVNFASRIIMAGTNIDLQANSVSIARFASSNAGVYIGGTITPTAKLQVGGSITAASALAQGVYFNNTLVAAANNDVLVGLDINPAFNNGAFTGVSNLALRVAYIPSRHISFTQRPGYGDYGRIQFTNVTGADIYSSGRIDLIPSDASQTVGLGNTITSQRLAASTNWGLYSPSPPGFSVGGNAAFGFLSNNADVNTDSFVFAGPTGARHFFKVVQNNVPYFTIMPTGNVLINTTTDSGYKLDVNGTARFTTGTAGTGIYLTSTVSGNSGTLTISPNATAIGTQADFTISSGNGTRLFLGGNYQTLITSTMGLSVSNGVGIGGNLTVSGGGSSQIYSTDFVLGGIANTSSSIYFTSSGYSESKILWRVENLGSYGRSNLHLCINGDSATTRATISDAKVSFLTNGNVGIGTTNPGYTLEAVGANFRFGRSATVDFDIANTGAGVYLRLSTTSTDSVIQNLGSNDIGFNNNFARVMTLKSTGNVLIGTTTDAGYKLYVNGVIRSTSDVVAELSLKSNYQAGDEGGEITLNKPATGTVIDTSVTIDIYQNKLRIFESGGLNRGGYFDISGLSNGVGTNFSPTGYTGILNIMGNPPGQQNVHINNGIITSID